MPEGKTLSTLALQDDDGLLRRVALDVAPVAGREPAADSAARAPHASRRALDWFVFGVADVQTGFGPFVAVYLTTQAWTQVDIGLVLTVGGLVALLGQMPGGALVDAVRSTRWAASLAVLAIGISALALGLWPVFPIVMASRVLHAAASCVLGPAIAAISLGLVGHAALGERIGRNARFASIGAGLSAAAMGASGHFLSNQSVFLVTAALVVPTLLALSQIRMSDVGLPQGQGAGLEHRPLVTAPTSRNLLRNRPLVIFAACILLFHLANAAMLPLMAGVMATRASESAAVSIAVCMIVPQLVVAAFSPWVGRQSACWGRRPLLAAAFAALVVRGLMFALAADPYAVIAIQLLDGVSAAVLGVMFPLVVADVTRESGRFNLALGIVGSAVGIGASLSTTLAGYMADHFGRGATFTGLAGLAALGLVLVLLLMPETRPDQELDAHIRLAPA
ncbi:MAG: MFS transporter [Xanthobacteraceae bacterium]